MTTQQITPIPAIQITAGNNDRTVFDPVALRELSNSIKEHSLIQPITVRQSGANQYQIIAGERRFRACLLLGWETIPCIIIDASDEEASAIMLSENISRKDLDLIDEAHAYQSRMDLFGWSVSRVAEAAGVTPMRVQNRIKLLKLSQEIQHMVRTGNIGIGFAQVMCDFNLDYNRQLLAVSKLRDNPRPTWAWFQNIVRILFTQQAQCTMFDAPLFGGPLEQYIASQPISEPPEPATASAPVIGDSPVEILSNQVSYWDSAAEQWNALGKPFKRQECQAASKVLQYAINEVFVV